MSIKDLASALRPAHWAKNFLVLAPLFFTGRIADRALLAREALAFAVFCAAASAVYLFNDWRDAPADRAHERKKNRAYASGRMSARTLWVLLGLCLGLAAAGCAFLPPGVALMAAAYMLGMVLYSLLLKRWLAAGAMIVALGMIARIFAGAEAIGACVSAWVIPCTFFLTCFVIAGKRIYDAAPDAAGNGGERLVAAFAACGAVTLACYVFYCFTDVTIQKYESRWVVLSASPVALGLWRYAHIVRRAPRRAEHFQAALCDPVMACALCVWLGVFAAIIYT